MRPIFENLYPPMRFALGAVTSTSYRHPKTSCKMEKRLGAIVIRALLLLAAAWSPIAFSMEDTRGELVDFSSYPEYVDRWAVIVGISHYADDRLNLRYADRDAERLYELIRKPSGGGFEEDHVIKLTNEQGTTREINKALRSFLKKPGKDDIVLLYFAAHGMPDPERPKNVYLITHDTDPDDISGTALPMREIRASLRENLYAQRVVLLADTCHSAAVGSGLAGRSAADRAGVVNRYLEDVGKSQPGLAIMTSAEAGEVALENERWGGGHGVFTHFVLEGMRGAADRQEEDGVVTVGELFDYVRAQVERATEHKQHPSIGQTQYDRRLPMAITGGATATELYRLGLGLYELGLERKDTNQLEYAASNFREATRLARLAGTRHRGSELELGRALLALKRFPEALETLEGVADSGQGSRAALDANLLVGMTHALLGQDQQAEKRYRSFLARDPEDSRVPLVRRMVERSALIGPDRHALLIAESEMPTIKGDKLPGPANDLERMRGVLEKQGFATVSLPNPNRVRVTEAFRRLRDDVASHDIVFIHYAGPGGLSGDVLQLVGDSGDREPIDSDQLHGLLMDIPAREKTVVLDTTVTEHLLSLARGSDGYALLTGDQPGKAFTAIEVDGQHFGLLSYELSKLLERDSAERLTFAELLPILNASMSEYDQPPRFRQRERHQRPSFAGPSSQRVLGSSARHLVLDQLLYAERVPYVDESRIVQDSLRLHATGVDLPSRLLYAAGRSLLEKQQYGAAESLLETALSGGLADDPDAVMALAVARVGSEHFEEALAGLRSAIAALPPSRARGPSSVLGELLPVVESLASGPRALLVGIDQGPSRAASRNVEVTGRWLKNVLGLGEADQRILLNSDATGPRILEEFQNLARASRYRTGVFFFSGPVSEPKRGEPIVAQASAGSGVHVSRLASLAGRDIELFSIFDLHEASGRKRETDEGNRPAGERGRFWVPPQGWSALLQVGRATLYSFSKGGAVPVRSATGEIVRLSMAELLEERLPTPDTKVGEAAERIGLPSVIGDSSMPLSRVDTPRLWSDVKRKLKERGRRATIAATSRLVERRKGKYPEGLISLGAAHASLGEIDKGVAALEQAMMQGSPAATARARFELGKVLFENKRSLARAVDALRETTHEDPSNLAAWFYLGQSIRLLARGDLMTEAREALRRYVDAGAPLGREDEIETFLLEEQGSQRQEDKRTQVTIYWHSKGFPRDAAVELQQRLEGEGMEVSVIKHVNPAAPDAAFIGALVEAGDAREVFSGLPYQVNYLYPLDYPRRHGGDDKGQLIGIGYISSHWADKSSDPRMIPVPVSAQDLVRLLDSSLSNTQFQLLLRDLLHR